MQPPRLKLNSDSAFAPARGRQGERAGRWQVWLGLLALAGYMIFLGTRTTAAAGASDSSGYLNGARLLAAGRLQAKLRLPPEFRPPTQIDQRHFTPLGFVTSHVATQMTPAYATGLPLHFALAGKLLGWERGPWLVELLAAGLAVWLCYIAGRGVGLGVPLAMAGATVLAVFPVFLFTSIQALSDTLATTWCLATLAAALRARSSARWAALTGFAFSIAVLVRPTNLFLAPAYLVLIGFGWRQLGSFVLAGLPAAVWLGFYNYHQFGGISETGYGDVSADFSRANGWPTLQHFVRWLGLMLPGILLGLPLAALGSRVTRGRELLALGLGFSLIAGFYLFYDISQQVWWCLRYILPVVPFLILAALLGVEALARGPGARWPRAFLPAATLIIMAWALGSSWYWTSRLHVFMVQQYEQTYADASRLARDRLPREALVIANNFSGAIYYYTDFAVLRADVVEAAEFARYAAIARAAGRPVCGVLFDFEEEEALRQRCPGNWRRLSTYKNVGYWQLE